MIHRVANNGKKLHFLFFAAVNASHGAVGALLPGGLHRSVGRGCATGLSLIRMGLRALLLPLCFATGILHAQTDYSGTYYIASHGFVEANTTTNYYLCPSESWYYYTATTPFYTSTDNGQPFMTTYKCRNGVYDSQKAVWIVQKHPSLNYYYIIHAIDGKYLTYNGQMATGNVGRMRLHLEATADGDNALFQITYVSGSGATTTFYITTKNGGPEETRRYVNVTGNAGAGNQETLQAASTKTDGPGGMAVGGIIGLWTAGDENGKWYLEKATIDPPVITNNYTVSNTFTITAATGATIYYTTDGSTPTMSSPNSGTTTVNITQTPSMSVIKAIAMDPNFPFPTAVTTYTIPVCKRPFISVNSSDDVTMTCATAGASIYYTTDGSEATSSATLYSGPFNIGSITTIRAIAAKTGYYKSTEAIYYTPVIAHSSDDINEMNRFYILDSDFTSTSPIGTASEPFQGTIDGQLITFSGLDHALVAYADGATIKNVIVDNVTLSGGTNVGAICNEASGDTRIYNCGVLATGSSVSKDENGYDELTSCSSTLSGSGYVGGIVGLLDGTSRVINCFSYANITGGSYVGGIVGYNNVDYDYTNYKTMVMNCMYYGDITGGSSKAPVYNGKTITNDGDNNGVNNFNYFRIEADYVQNQEIDVYNCALGAETRFLQRFEFYRHLLNSHRELAAWWATGDADNEEEIMKWVLEPSQIGTTTPYPILKAPGKYASVVNYVPNETAYDEAHRCEGRKLTSEGDGGVLHVTIQMGDGEVFDRPFKGTEDAATITTDSLDLTITDKDTAHFNFNYGKVQLPYYNEVGTQNYRDNRVVTGWKIVSITGTGSGTTSYVTGASDVTYDGSDNLTATPYNFADRHCTAKDLYGTGGSNRIFNQGAYWDVPIGVTDITIEPYWGKAVYLADEYFDKVYNADMTTPHDVVNAGGKRYENGQEAFNGQIVYTTLSNAIASSALYAGIAEATRKAHSVYDYAVVLVGNYHHYAAIEASEGKPYTVTTVDLDGDNEPDYSFILRFDGRIGFHPVKYDFLNIVGLGMAQKSTGGTGTYNLGIMQPKYWFEVTNTALFRVTQFEYSQANRVKKPYILQGGVIEQWVTQQQDAGDKVEYFHVGGNVWFKEFHRGSHQDNANKSTPHPPVSVTGGDYAEFYLTGLYQSQAATYDDNAECYINGGRFGEMAGAGMEGIGTSDGKGNITWVIDHADIKYFYGGGINYDKPVHGNIHTFISNSYVERFCGGPKFGDMENNRTVRTEATGCTFGTFFGAGYGGNSYNRYVPTNKNNVVNISWNDWVSEVYKQEYSSTYKGVSTEIDYQFIPVSNNTKNVCRLWVEYVSFSLATTHSVTSTLTDCTVEGNFYGGGSHGKVDGPVTSTLDNCTVLGSVFGAGYSAALPTVEVMDLTGFQIEPYYYEALGSYRIGVPPTTTTYTWEQAETVNSTATAINKTTHTLYTTENLNDLGKVIGDVEVKILGHSTILGNVYGGGNMGTVDGNTHVIIGD